MNVRQTQNKVLCDWVNEAKSKVPFTSIKHSNVLSMYQSIIHINVGLPFENAQLLIQLDLHNRFTCNLKQGIY